MSELAGGPCPDSYAPKLTQIFLSFLLLSTLIIPSILFTFLLCFISAPQFRHPWPS
jgi:hypothetical protein